MGRKTMITLESLLFHKANHVITILRECRGSPDSTNFGSQDNHVIRGILLIGDWFSTKTHENDKFDFQSPLFYMNNKFSYEKSCHFVEKPIINDLKYPWIKMFLFFTIEKLIFTSENLNFYDCKFNAWTLQSCRVNFF